MSIELIAVIVLGVLVSTVVFWLWWNIPVDWRNAERRYDESAWGPLAKFARSWEDLNLFFDWVSESWQARQNRQNKGGRQ